MWIKIEVFTSVWDQTAWILYKPVLYVEEEFKAFLTTSCSPFYTAMYPVELLPASPCTLLCLISPGLGFPFSTSSSSVPTFVVLLVFSKRSGNWRAVSGRLSKKLLNSIIFTNTRWENNFSIFFINLFIKWIETPMIKDGGYGWVVCGVVCFWVFPFFFLFNLTFWVETFSDVGGHPH